MSAKNDRLVIQSMIKASCIMALLCTANAGRAADKPLFDTLFDVTIQFVKNSGPNADVARFISASGPEAWSRRQELVEAVSPYLKDEDPIKVAGAIEVLYRLRTYRPMSCLGNFEQENAEFHLSLDKLIMAQLRHAHSLNNAEVYHQLALFLGVSPSEESKRELLKIANETPEKEQALICLAWHRDPQDMKSLLPFMLEDSATSRALPYHFRNSYGEAALPFLKQAVAEAKSEATRREANEQLSILKQSAQAPR